MRGYWGLLAIVCGCPTLPSKQQLHHADACLVWHESSLGGVYVKVINGRAALGDKPIGWTQMDPPRMTEDGSIYIDDLAYHLGEQTSLYEEDGYVGHLESYTLTVWGDVQGVPQKGPMQLGRNKYDFNLKCGTADVALGVAALHMYMATQDVPDDPESGESL